MATLSGNPSIELSVTLTLTEAEARALLELSAYDAREIVRVINDNLSVSLVTNHRNGLVSLLKTCGPPLSDIITRINTARQAFTK